jgi:twitching motility protein PilT
LLDGTAPAIRVDGALRVLGDEPPCKVAELLRTHLSEAEWARVEAGRSVDLPLHDEALGSFRINVFRARDGVAAAIRTLPHEPPPLAELGLPASLEDLVALPHGLVIVCGPTGAGKSTTLAALANEAVRRRPALLVSLEDPIEYLLGRGAKGLVRQRQIGRDAVDYPTGLRDALREDPDVLLIGEMRDPESISLALTAAETGHLVLTSMHSRSAASAVERIADVYAPERQRPLRAQLADSLRAVVSQRLLPRADGSGRVVALEVMRVNHGVAALIREGNTAQIATAMQAGRRDGMLPLERCLADLVRSGRVTRTTAVAFANDAAALAQYLDTRG